VNFLVYRYVVD